MIFQDPKFSQKWTNFEQNKHLENRLYRPNVYKTVIYGQTSRYTRFSRAFLPHEESCHGQLGHIPLYCLNRQCHLMYTLKNRFHCLEIRKTSFGGKKPKTRREKNDLPKTTLKSSISSFRTEMSSTLLPKRLIFLFTYRIS